MLSLELGIVTVLIVINGLLSMSELAIVSSRPARLAALVEKGVRGSRRALALASDPGKFLSTVQIGITLIGLLEVLQLWAPGRHARVEDFLVDAATACAGLVLAAACDWVLTRLRSGSAAINEGPAE